MLSDYYVVLVLVVIHCHGNQNQSKYYRYLVPGTRYGIQKRKDTDAERMNARTIISMLPTTTRYWN